MAVVVSYLRGHDVACGDCDVLLLSGYAVQEEAVVFDQGGACDCDQEGSECGDCTPSEDHLGDFYTDLVALEDLCVCVWLCGEPLH